MENSHEEVIEIPDYEIGLQLQKNYYHFYIRELKLSGKGETLEEAYHNLNLKKKEMIRDFRELGILEELPTPKTKLSQFIGKPVGMMGFLFKGLVVVGVLVFTLMSVGNIVEKKSEQALIKLEMLKNDLMVKFQYAKHIKPGRHLANELNRAANKEFSAEKQQELIKSIQILVGRYKPVIDEIRPLFSDQTQK